LGAALVGPNEHEIGPSLLDTICTIDFYFLLNLIRINAPRTRAFPVDYFGEGQIGVRERILILRLSLLHHPRYQRTGAGVRLL
jgi:hypothetical protein